MFKNKAKKEEPDKTSGFLDFETKPGINPEKEAEEDKETTEESPEFDVKTEKETPPVKTKPLSFNLYRKIAFSFIILTILLLSGVFYFSLPSLKISITPEKSIINDDLTVNVFNNNEESLDQNLEPSITGILGRVRLEEEKEFLSTGARTVGREIEGKVTIINNYSQDQLLVDTTRLLSPEGKLYRTRERVNVPAGGSVEVEIYSDDPSPEMAIEPTKFTIPGLWAGIQSDIYAESEEAFEYRVKLDRYIQQADIDKAIEETRQALEEKIRTRFSSSYEGRDRVLYKIDENSIETSVDSQAEDEKDEFQVKMSAAVNIIAFENQKIIDLATNKLKSIISEDKNLLNFYGDKISFSWHEFDFDNDLATIKLSISGEVAATEESAILDKNEITSLNQEQLVYYLEDNSEIKDYQLNFYPSFIKKVPNLSDRIEIEIKLD